MVPDYLFKVAKKKQNFGKVARSCSSAKKLLRGQKVAKKLPSTIWLCLMTSHVVLNQQFIFCKFLRITSELDEIE